MTEHPKLYKIDSKGKLRVWFIKSTDTTYQVVSGINDGKLVESTPKIIKGKNIGKANETSPREQILKEVASLYEKQEKTEGYYPNIEDAGKGKSYFSPMLAEKFSEKDCPDYVYQSPKFDGFRCVVYDDRIHSREGEPFLSVPHIQEAMKPLIQKHPSIVFDGELYNHKYKDEFEKIQSILTKRVNISDEDLKLSKDTIQYFIYGIYDRDRPNMTMVDRVSWMDENLAYLPECIQKVRQLYIPKEKIMEYYWEELNSGFEGQMLVDPDSVYEVDKRSKSLRKHKPVFDTECIIVSVTEGVGNWQGAVKSIEVKDIETGNISEAGVDGKREFNQYLWSIRHELIGTMVTIEHRGVTKHNKFRFPVCKKFWLDTTRKY